MKKIVIGFIFAVTCSSSLATDGRWTDQGQFFSHFNYIISEYANSLWYVSSNLLRAKKAITNEINPTITQLKIKSMPKFLLNKFKQSVSNTSEPLTKLGTVVVTVDLILVPNCSEAMVTNTAQYPAANPRKAQIQ